MAKIERVIIMKYVVPEVGIYTIDEGMVLLFNDEEVNYPDSIAEAKDLIRDSISNLVKTKREDYLHKIETLNNINVGLIDEKYRIKAFK
jgi:hypothetical protein